MTGRIARLLPGEPFLGGPPASRLCCSTKEVEQQLEAAVRMKVHPLALSQV